MKLFWITLASFFFLSSPVFGTSKEIMLDMIDYIIENSEEWEYSYNGEPLPRLELMDRYRLCSLLFPGLSEEKLTEEKCTFAGKYNHEINTVVVVPEPIGHYTETNLVETILLHEMVHYLQFINGIYEKVRCFAELERDAYALQEKYVEDMGFPEENKPDPLFSLFVSMCPQDHHLIGPTKP